MKKLILIFSLLAITASLAAIPIPFLAQSNLTVNGYLGLNGSNITSWAEIQSAATATIYPGDAWESYDSPPGATVAWHDSAYGNGVFVFVGEPTTTGGIIGTTTNGTSWDYTTVGGALWQVEFGDGVFVAASPNTPWRTAVSTNGYDWNEYTNVGVSVAAMTYGDGVFAGVGQHGITQSVYVASSDRGVTWVSDEIYAGALGSASAGGMVHDGTQFIYRDNVASFTSATGTNWARTTNASPLIIQMRFYDGVFYATDYSGGFYSSDDSVTWTALATNGFASLLTFCNNGFFKTIGGFSTGIARSDDGTVWESSLGYSAGTMAYDGSDLAITRISYIDDAFVSEGRTTTSGGLTIQSVTETGGILSTYPNTKIFQLDYDSGLHLTNVGNETIRGYVGSHWSGIGAGGETNFPEGAQEISFNVSTNVTDITWDTSSVPVSLTWPLGTQGEQGIQGDPGIDYTVSAFLTNTIYYPSNAVTFGGQIWGCTSTVTATVAPTNDPAHWTLLVTKGTDGTDGTDGSDALGFSYAGTWATGRVYAADTSVRYGSVIWVTTNGAAANETPGLSTPWTSFIQDGTDGLVVSTNALIVLDYTVGVSYPSNAIASYGGQLFYSLQDIGAGDIVYPGSSAAYWQLIVTKGANGANGTDGTDGTDGVGNLAFRTNYQPTASYDAGDIVLNNGSAFYALSGVSGTEPPNLTYWGIFSEKGDSGLGTAFNYLYDDLVTYAAGELMAESNTIFYALQTVTPGQYPRADVDTTFWKRLVLSGRDGGVMYPQGSWSNAVVYGTNDLVESGGSSWYSLQNANSNHLPALASPYWSLFVAKGDTGATGPSGAVTITNQYYTNIVTVLTQLVDLVTNTYNVTNLYNVTNNYNVTNDTFVTNYFTTDVDSVTWSNAASNAVTLTAGVLDVQFIDPTNFLTAEVFVGTVTGATITAGASDSVVVTGPNMTITWDTNAVSSGVGGSGTITNIVINSVMGTTTGALAYATVAVGGGDSWDVGSGSVILTTNGATYGANSIAIGDVGPRVLTNEIFIGHNLKSAYTGGMSQCIMIGRDLETTASVDVYASEYAPIYIGSSSTGSQDNIVIGHGSLAQYSTISIGNRVAGSARYAVAVGNNTLIGHYDIAIGENADVASGNVGGIAIGYQSDSGSGVSIGRGAGASDGTSIGYLAESGASGVAIGRDGGYKNWSGARSIIIGSYSDAMLSSYAIGQRTYVSATNAICIGDYQSNCVPNSVVIGGAPYSGSATITHAAAESNTYFIAGTCTGYVGASYFGLRATNGTYSFFHDENGDGTLTATFGLTRSQHP